MLRYCQIPEVRHPAPRPPPPLAIRALGRALPARLTPPHHSQHAPLSAPDRHVRDGGSAGCRWRHTRRQHRWRRAEPRRACDPALRSGSARNKRLPARAATPDSATLATARVDAGRGPRGRVPCAAFDSRALDRRARCSRRGQFASHATAAAKAAVQRASAHQRNTGSTMLAMIAMLKEREAADAPDAMGTTCVLRRPTLSGAPHSPLPTRPLMRAAAAGDVAEVKALMARGAQVQLRNKVGQEALTLARDYQRRECAAVLARERAVERLMNSLIAKPVRYQGWPVAIEIEAPKKKVASNPWGIGIGKKVSAAAAGNPFGRNDKAEVASGGKAGVAKKRWIVGSIAQYDVNDKRWAVGCVLLLAALLLLAAGCCRCCFGCTLLLQLPLLLLLLLLYSPQGATATTTLWLTDSPPPPPLPLPSPGTRATTRGPYCAARSRESGAWMRGGRPRAYWTHASSERCRPRTSTTLKVPSARSPWRPARSLPQSASPHSARPK